MSQAVLTILGDGTGAVRAFGDVTAASRASARAVLADWRRVGAGVASTLSKMSTDEAREQAARVRTSQRAARAREQAEKGASAVARAEGTYRQSGAKTEADKAVEQAQRVEKAREKSEKAATAASMREASRRAAIDRQRTREAAENERARTRSVGARARGLREVGGVAFQFASTAHGMIQDARQTAARRETDLDSTFLQLVPQGADAAEIARMRATIRQYAHDQRMDPDALFEAVGAAQSAHNALGGATPALRAQALQQTLRDANFASVIDPRSPGGITRLGALLRGQGGVTPEIHDAILRQAAGISFQGSVETDAALQSGLPGLMRAISTNTANTPDAERGRVVQETIADFLAQVQTTAASGGAVTVSANRMGALRGSLTNAYRQDQIGRALANRVGTMTADQRAEFGSAFTRDRRGRYTMNADMAASPSAAARFFGHMFGNDANAARNFLGTHGGGGNRQLLRNNEAELLTSYFATGQNAAGQTVRQYDLVEELKRATVTAQQEQIMRQVRGGEDQLNLNREESDRERALTDNTSVMNRLSNAVSGWLARNPLAGAAISAGGTVAGGSMASSALSAAGGTALGGAAVNATAASAQVVGSLAVGVAVGEGIMHGARAGASRLHGRDVDAAYGSGHSDSIFSPGMLGQFVDAIREGIMGAEVRVATGPVAPEVHAVGNKAREPGRVPRP